MDREALCAVVLQVSKSWTWVSDWTELNRWVPKYIKQIIIDIKERIDNNMVIVEDYNALLLSVDKSSRQKTNKEIVVLNDRQDGLNKYLQNSYLIQSSKIHILLKCIWNFLQDRSHARSQKYLNKFNKLKLYQASFLTTMVWNQKLIMGIKMKK